MTAHTQTASKTGRDRTLIGRLRVMNQRILGSSFRSPEDAVRFMVALQAQDLPGARWSIGLRVPGTTDVDIRRALDRGTIVRSWPMRGTLHITLAEDLPWMLETLASRIVAGSKGRLAALDLDERTIERARAIAHGHLEGGKASTRADMLARFERARIKTDGQRGYHILWHLAHTGSLCFGPSQGNEQTFVMLDEWIEKPRRLVREEALGELARRYFTSHGPATVADFAWWTKLSMRDAKVGLAVAKPHVMALMANDVDYYMAADAEDVLARAPSASTVAALPGFDEFVLGYQDRSSVLDPSHADRIVPGKNGMFMPTIVVEGRIVGTWRRTHETKQTRIVPLPFVALSKSQESSFRRAAEAYGAFVGRPVTIARA